jgi:hypothetical protein
LTHHAWKRNKDLRNIVQWTEGKGVLKVGMNIALIKLSEK